MKTKAKPKAKDVITAGCYIQLFHGRRDPKASLEDWGELGPVFGPCDWFHTTYCNDIKFNTPEQPDCWLRIIDDMVYYDGVYYGDWSVTHAGIVQASDRLSAGNLRSRIVPFDPVKANHHFVESPESIAEYRVAIDAWFNYLAQGASIEVCGYDDKDIVGAFRARISPREFVGVEINKCNLIETFDMDQREMKKPVDVFNSPDHPTI